MYNDYANGAWAKNSSFVNFGLQGWLAAVCKCAVCAGGFLFLCAGGEKNKINSHQVSTYLSSKSLVLFSCLFIQRVKISKLKFRSDTLAYNGWRYEKLPIAGDFLSSYTKVEAGYNT